PRELRRDVRLREELAQGLVDAPHATLPAWLELLLADELLAREEALVLEALRQRARLVVGDLPREIVSPRRRLLLAQERVDAGEVRRLVDRDLRDAGEPEPLEVG